MVKMVKGCRGWQEKGTGKSEGLVRLVEGEKTNKGGDGMGGRVC